MGKKKKKPAKPWCWYCDREFEDEKILINHQKAKHFKCYQCHKKLTTGTGLAIHLYSVHKETITTVPNAKDGRNTLKPDIIGMDGVPEDAVRGAAAAGSDDEDGTKRARVDPSQPVPKAYIPPPSNVLPTLSQLGPPPPAPAPYPKPAGMTPAPLLSSAGPAPAPHVAPMHHPPPMGAPQGLPPQAMPHYGPPHMHPGFPGGHPPPYGYPPAPYGFMPGPPGHGMPPLNPALSGFAPPPMYNQPPPMHAPVAPPAFAAYANSAAAGAAATQPPRKSEDFIPFNAPAAVPAAAAVAAPSAAPAAAGAVLMVYDDEFQSPEERRASLRRYSFEPK